MIAIAEQDTEPWHAFTSSNTQDTSQLHFAVGSLAGSWAFLILQSLFTSSKLRMTNPLGQHKEKNQKSEFQICRILIKFRMKKVPGVRNSHRTKPPFSNPIQWTTRFLYFIEYIKKALQKCLLFCFKSSLNSTSHSCQTPPNNSKMLKQCCMHFRYEGTHLPQTFLFLLSILKQNEIRFLHFSVFDYIHVFKLWIEHENFLSWGKYLMFLNLQCTDIFWLPKLLNICTDSALTAQFLQHCWMHEVRACPLELCLMLKLEGKKKLKTNRSTLYSD